MDQNIKKPYQQYYDSVSDTFWVVLKKGFQDSYQEIMPGVRLELDKDSNPIGLEIQNYSRLLNIKYNTSKDSLNNIKTLSMLAGKTYPLQFNTNYKY